MSPDAARCGLIKGMLRGLAACLLLFSAVSVVVVRPLPADAAPAATASPKASYAVPLTAVQAQQLLDVLQDPARRGALIETLQSLEKVVSTAAPPPAAPPPASVATPKASPVQLRHNGLVAELGAQAASLGDETNVTLSRTAREITDFPALAAWLRRCIADRNLQRTIWQAAMPLSIVLLLGFAMEWLTVRAMRSLHGALTGPDTPSDARPPRAGGEGPVPTEEHDREAAQGHRPFHAGWLLLRRLPSIMLVFLLTAAPPLAFLASAFLLMATPLARSAEVRDLTLEIASLYVRGRIAYCLVLALIASPAYRLRLFHAPDAAATFIRIWAIRIISTLVCGYVLGDVALYLGMPPDLELGFIHVLALAVHAMAVWAILECRKPVSRWIAGDLGDSSRRGRVRHAYSRIWHIQAVVLVVAVWIVFATAGTAGTLHIVVASIFVLLGARICSIVLLGGLDRLLGASAPGVLYPAIRGRAVTYHRPLRIAAIVIIAVATLLALLEAWGLTPIDWLIHDRVGRQLSGSVTSLLITLVVAVMVWEASNLGMQSYLDGLVRGGAIVRAARLRTIVPLLRNALLIVLIIVIGLTTLSALGVNIGPLLAGAGIFGVALGFGSQKLVQDFITGIFLLIENAMQVGDFVTAGGLSGTVENLSIRTLRLRAGDGSVHLIPFSAVSTVTNTNRGTGNAAIAVTVDYEEDTDRAADILKQIALDMRKEDAFTSGMLSELQYWGVDKVDGTTATLVGQIVCTAGARWAVQREYNRRVKLAFQHQGVRMLPAVTVMALRHPLDVRLEHPTVAPDDSPATS